MKTMNATRKPDVEKSPGKSAASIAVIALVTGMCAAPLCAEEHPAAVSEAPAPASAEDYQALLRRVANEAHQSRKRLGRAREALEARKAEIKGSNPKCGELAADIETLRNQIAAKEAAMEAVFSQDKQVQELSAELDEVQASIDESRNKVMAMIRERKLAEQADAPAEDEQNLKAEKAQQSAGEEQDGEKTDLE